jgi:ubiquitin-protein ligase
MNVRIKRLSSDYEQVLAAFRENPYIRLLATQGNPPEKYTFEIKVAAPVPTADDGFSIGNNHKVEVFLPVDYPRRAPFCRMITPVFHPNIAPEKICIGDHWSAAQSLAQLLVRIAEMLCYQSYNVKSPLNAKAAVWAQQNVAQLPLQKVDLMAGL